MKIYSNFFPGLLIHMIHRYHEAERDRKDLVSPDQFIQVAAIKQKKEVTYKPHHHIWGEATGPKIAQESWVVISGSVEVTFYDIDNKLIHTDILNPGDCSITLQGGHNYKFLTDGFVYEFKTGPYQGVEKDKVLI